jgi:hypothetical protein
MAGPEILIPIAFFISATTVVRMVLRHRERRFEIEAQGGAGGGRESAMRLERMEQAIDAMAVEIERISEAQRFTTRLLTEGVEQSGRLPSHDTRR